MNELTHWGIKGQKWGVRRYQNPDGTLTEAGKERYGKDSEVSRVIKGDKLYLKKGTRLNSVSTKYYDSDKYKNRSAWMYTYRDDEEWDNKVYKGPFAAYMIDIRDKGATYVAEHKYITTKDLKIPTKKQRIEEFKTLNSKDLIKDLKEVQKLIVERHGSEEYRKRVSELNLDNIKTEKDWETAYSIFNHAMEASWYYKSTQEYVKKMSKKFDAMVDDNNKDTYNRAVDPIIIFRANEALKTVKDIPIADFLTIDDIEKNYMDVEKELEKYGEAVKL